MIISTYIITLQKVNQGNNIGQIKLIIFCENKFLQILKNFIGIPYIKVDYGLSYMCFHINRLFI